jgi:hypothetical protein
VANLGAPGPDRGGSRRDQRSQAPALESLLATDFIEGVSAELAESRSRGDTSQHAAWDYKSQVWQVVREGFERTESYPLRASCSRLLEAAWEASPVQDDHERMTASAMEINVQICAACREYQESIS